MNTSTHKAWVAGISATIVPILLQNLTGTSQSARVAYNFIVCGIFGSTCPDPNAVADAVWVILSGVLSGIVVGGLTWFIKNRPKSDSDIVPKAQER
jgi:hypothetical protein